MKNFIISFLALCSFVSFASAQMGFEGTLTWSMKIPQLGDKESPFVISSKGDKTLIHMDAGPTGAVDIYTDKSSHKTIMVMKAMSMGYEIDTPDEPVKKEDSKASKPKATGKKEKINGYNCEEYVCELEGESEMSMWMTSDLKDNLIGVMAQALKKGMSSSGSHAGSGMEELMKKGLAPIRTIITKDGKQQAEMTFVSFESKTLSDDLFVVPTGINIMKMPAGMGKGMGQ